MARLNRTAERAFTEMLSALTVVAALIALGIALAVLDFASNGLLAIVVALAIVIVLVAAACLFYMVRERRQAARRYADHCRHHVGQMIKQFTGMSDAQKQLTAPPMVQTVEEIMGAGMSAMVGRRCWVFFRRVDVRRGSASIAHFVPGIEDEREANPAFDMIIKGLQGKKPELLIPDIDAMWEKQFAVLPEMTKSSADQALLPLLGPQIGRGWHMPWKSFAIVPVKAVPAAMKKRRGKSWAEQAEEAEDDTAEEKLYGYLSIACDARDAFDVTNILHDARGYAHMLGDLLIAINQIERSEDLEMVD